jgi:hypothetical protein
MPNVSRIALAFAKTRPLVYLVIFITEESNTEETSREPEPDVVVVLTTLA